MSHSPLSMFAYDDYRKAISAWLQGTAQSKPRGAVKSLAQALKCHATFISHVSRGKADFSVQQALRFCRHFDLTAEETAYFMDLVERDKAADEETKRYFNERLDQKRREHRDLAKRLKVDHDLTAMQETLYFKSWIYQAAHSYCQLPGPHTVASIAAALRAEPAIVEHVLRALISLGFVVQDGQAYQSTPQSFHLRSDSPAVAKSHCNWRLKTIDELLHSGERPAGTHYSSVFSMSLETATEIRAGVLSHIEKMRQKIIPSPPDQLFVYCLDFFQLTK